MPPFLAPQSIGSFNKKIGGLLKIPASILSSNRINRLSHCCHYSIRPMVTKVGIAFFAGSDEWAVVLCPGNYFSSQTWIYEIVVRKNSVWYRRDHNSMVENEQGYRGLLHVGDINVELSVLHGRMQSIYSGIGRGHPNPTHLPWGKKPWVIRVLLVLQQEYGIQLPRCTSADLVGYIESRIISLSGNVIPLIG